MNTDLNITIAQINPTVGDISGNQAKIIDAYQQAVAQEADLVVYGELTVSGYPPEDLVLKPAFQQAIEVAVMEIVACTADQRTAILLGAPWLEAGKLYNAALLLEAGEIKAIRYKHFLPNYGVFDEKRVFSSGPLPGPVSFRDARLGVMICEDMWFGDVSECLQESGADFLVVLNGSPYESDKRDERLNFAVARINETGLPLIYVNLVGGQDELVFDGGSFVLGAECRPRAKLPSWQEHLQLTRWSQVQGVWGCADSEISKDEAPLVSIYQAMVLGLRDYVNKNGFPGVIIGLSGGIDSALSAAVAVDALGPERVHCVMMESPYTSHDSLEDAEEAARLLRVKLRSVPIKPAMEAFDTMLSDEFAGKSADTTEENIQSRSRGLILMALSNKLGLMVLTTGNKSEMSVGYATLYGDMCGGYSVLKDVYKVTVFELSRLRNNLNENAMIGFFGPHGRVIPERTITKPPSAELKPDQVDEDSLPPYDVLDGILKCLVEEELSTADIARKGYDPELVQRIWRMLDRTEYKRRQAPPGVKLTRRAFGRDRRYPITNGFLK